ncbi:TraI/MobA(P) family conjugative relaxase [Pseudovibrio ascidiaceicola]|uniref:TraI/MobA(P) family conjugative relaxase n=1 Tax=Pseudovibrio ascidiaceicola TaxID=285279 RepID=UPI003D3608B2
MIAHKIDRKSGQNSFKALARYVAAAKEDNEKLGDLWIENCELASTKDELELAIVEIENTQKHNTRVKGDRSYHLVISFAQGEVPELAALKDIEKSFAKALGFEEHERIIGTHTNTDNFHMHVAINRIHPKTYKVHVPYYDFDALERTRLEMEVKYALTRTNAKGEVLDKTNPKARDYEANTYEVSFSTYVKDYKQELLKIRENSKTWPEFHEGIAAYSLELKKRGNGLVFKELDGPRLEKASTVHRDFSKKALEDKFGPYQAPEKDLSKAKRKDRYERRPLYERHRQTDLWKKFTDQLSKPKRKRKHSWKSFLTDYAQLNHAAIEMLKGEEAMLSLMGLGSKRQTGLLEKHFGKGPQSKSKRFPLSVARIEREEAKAAGAWWDRKNKQWFAPTREVYRTCAKWQQTLDTVEDMSAVEFEGNASTFIKEQGGELKQPIIMDGLWHSTRFEDADVGFYRAIAEGVPCVEVAKADLDPEETRDVLDVKVNDILSAESRKGLVWRDRRLDQGELETVKATTVERVKDMRARQAYVVWSGLEEPATPSSCPYLEQTGIRSHGLPVDRMGRMVVPLRDVDGDLHSLRFISTTQEASMRGAREDGLFHLLDPEQTSKQASSLKGIDTLIIANGFANAATLSEVSNQPVAAVFSKDDLKQVYLDVRSTYPDMKIVIATARSDELKLTSQQQAGAELISPPLGTNWKDWRAGKQAGESQQEFASLFPHLTSSRRQERQSEKAMDMGL